MDEKPIANVAATAASKGSKPIPGYKDKLDHIPTRPVREDAMIVMVHLR